MTNTYPLQMRKLTKPVVFLSVLMAMNSGLLAKEIAGKTIITRGIVQAGQTVYLASSVFLNVVHRFTERMW